MRQTVVLAPAPKHPAGTVPAPESINPDQLIDVLILLRAASSAEERQRELDHLTSLPPHKRKFPDRAAFAERHGATLHDLAVLRSFTAESGLVTRHINRAARSVALSGTVRNFEAAFRVALMNVQGPSGAYRSHKHPIQVPSLLHGIVEAVIGLDNRLTPQTQSQAGAPGYSSITPSDLIAHYDFPQRCDGRGRRIGIIELGGGFHRSDMEQYFPAFGLATPKITTVPVIPEVHNNPSPRALLAAFASGVIAGKLPAVPAGERSRLTATLETTLDLQVAGSLANGAELLVYFAAQTNTGMFQALAAALDPAKPRPDVISLSWSGPESQYEPGTRIAIDSALEAAALCGITVCCSSGDSGDGVVAGAAPEVMYPAANPLALACGGTQLVLGNGGSEAVWNELEFGAGRSSGGGVSGLYPMPAWQQHAGVASKLPKSGRGVPDVAAKADVHHGFPICVGGVLGNFGGGTSAASPLWAALLARISEALDSPLGCIHPLLYQKPYQQAFRDIIIGNNGTFHSSPGWDPCTGWGSPIGDRLLDLLRAGH